MDAAPIIRSRTNALLKRVGGVVAGKERGTLLLEGDRLLDDALGAGLVPEFVLVAEDRVERARELEAGGLEVRLVERGLLDKVSALETSPGVLALAPRPEPRPLAELERESTPRLLVIAGLADPGNLGALSRSAEGAGIAALVLVSGGARPFGPKALRGSMGSLLRLPVFEAGSVREVATHLSGAGFRQVTAATRGGTDWRAFDWSAPIALWVSGETGAELDAGVDFEAVTIPMAGGVESLNITVATSLLLFAAGGTP